MDELSTFCNAIISKMNGGRDLDISQARNIVRAINDFLYTNYDGIGETYALGSSFEYFSDFHKYWEKHNKEILDCQIDEEKCRAVAEALHSVYMRTGGGAFRFAFDDCGLKHEDICRIRLFTANQDFRGTRNFSDFARIFHDDYTIFDEEKIEAAPNDFVSRLGVSNLSQTDKRIKYAKNIASFVLRNECTPIDLIHRFNDDIYKLREALINCKGAGYGNKKADMFLRDMVVLGCWKNVKGFEKIDVASDVNTIKVALRTGIISTKIPLLSSFLDIFCHQYGYIDEMNAKAWRRVWEIWKAAYPLESISSPCLIDYFVYRVVGKQFCKEILYEFECETEHHRFKWHSGRNQTCQVCYKQGKKSVKAKVVGRKLPCEDSEGRISILKTDYVSSLPKEQKFVSCPFLDICGSNKKLMPPKSISIMGQTGWTSAYAKRGEGGGGLMS